MKKLIAALLFLVTLLPAQQDRLLVISIDGLDHRWLRDADELGVKIPTLAAADARRGSRRWSRRYCPDRDLALSHNDDQRGQRPQTWDHFQ